MDRPQLTPRWRNALLTVHIVSTVGVLGADLVLLVLGLTGLSGADPVRVYPAAQLIGSTIVAPFAAAALVTGLLLALLTPYGLLTYWWTVIKLAITVALAGAVYLILLPALATASTAALEGAQPASRAALVLAPAGGSALLVVAILLAVSKPRRRLCADHQPARSRAASPSADDRQGVPSR